ncbi:hypothetical protein Bca52824_024243 [Brassica carinata]|uniref:Uncharacterized protein n=1 Tax=Brassica carinata TaxID=52824 RepID=A0A8X7VK20_BRACI|nr:hypothetical protein Bca52824_024243 [Brassica carinata]
MEGKQRSKRRRATHKRQRARWTALEQAMESETRDRKGNRCSSMVQGRLIGSQT